jgi:hypothetical protein
LKTTGHIIARISKNDDGIIPQFTGGGKGMFQKLFSIAFALIVGMNADRAEGKNGFAVALLIHQPRFGVHDIADQLTVQFQNEGQFREKIRMVSHLVDKIMLFAAGAILIPECFTGKGFH